MPAITRRRAMGLGAGALAAGALAACSDSSAAPTSGTGAGDPAAGESMSVTIGFLPITCASPIISAASLGVFEKHGIDVTLKKFAGWADIWSAYASGELTVAHMLAPMPLAINHGLAGNRVGTRLALIANTNGQAITLAKRHMNTVSRARDMEGFTLGIPFDYSMHNFLLRDYLAADGLDPDRDVQIRVMRPADMVANLATGNIDGYLGPGPFNQRSVAAGHGYLHTLTSTMWAGHPCCSLAANTDWASSNPKTYAALVGAVTESAIWCDDPSHRVEAANSMAPEKFLNQDPVLLRSVLTGSVAAANDREPVDPGTASDRIGFQPRPDVASGMWIGTQFTRWGLGDLAGAGDTDTLRTAVEDTFDTRTVAEAFPSTTTPPSPRTEFTVNGRSFSVSDPWPWTDKEVAR